MRGETITASAKVLQWAREEQGLTIEELAAKLHTSTENVTEWESSGEITLPKLRSLAQTCHRSLGVFLLPEPPADFHTLRDFRRVHPTGGHQFSSQLRNALRDVEDRQQLAVELLDSTDERGDHSIQATPGELADDLARRIRAWLGVDLATQYAWPDHGAAYRAWRARLESRGVLVFQFSSVDVSEARGFSIASDVLPAIAVNASDLEQARSFTLMHELAHIALRGDVSVCDFSDGGDVEAFCNQVAGEVLVPSTAILAEPQVIKWPGEQDWSDGIINALSRRYSVSRSVVLRRLLNLGRTSPQYFKKKESQFVREAVAAMKARKEAQQKSKNGPAYLVTHLSRIGGLYPQLVLEAHARRSITLSDALSYLGVRDKHFEQIREKMSGRAA